MAFLDTAGFDDLRSFDPHRNDVLGAALSAAMPLAAAVAVNAMAAKIGFGGLLQLAGDNLPLAVFYFLLFPMWGVAHWLAAREGEAGHRAARWVLALIGWGLVYPFLAALFDDFWLSWLDVFSLLLIGTTAARLGPVSRPALILVLPSLLWVALAAIPGYVFLTNGWSPGFAVTVGALAETNTSDSD